ncbi:origin recognition complex subunit 6 [Choristoneura fumiferana]|uniref:origin recognition complex subunit 6 n=1 Tax=Choristoneura fumiferana TaxID=7141 RepID=UPI003D15B0DC
MASYNKTLQLLASKMGLREEDKVLSKAAEFERLLQTKTVAGSNLSDTSKVVICLDLAAGIYGVELDVKTAVKYSGLKPVAYTSNRKTVENLLELNTSKLSVPLLCVSLQCTGVQETAEKILEEYQRHAKVEVDLSLPQYVCMAVFQACRINKVKVSKVKINEKCRLKPAQWAKLEADWASFVNEKFNIAKKKRGRPAKNAVNSDDNQEMEADSKEEGPTEIEIEPYETWKQRMLESAYEELKQLKMKENETRLKSPRKATVKETNKILSKEVTMGTPQKKVTRGTPQKEVSRGTPQKVTSGTPSKEITRGSPQKEVSRGTPHKEVTRYTPPEDMFGNILNNMSPRRSPRKSPQKFSPYKTPNKNNGVRLLFPTNL